MYVHTFLYGWEIVLGMTSAIWRIFLTAFFAISISHFRQFFAFLEHFKSKITTCKDGKTRAVFLELVWIFFKLLVYNSKFKFQTKLAHKKSKTFLKKKFVKSQKSFPVWFPKYVRRYAYNSIHGNISRILTFEFWSHN